MPSARSPAPTQAELIISCVPGDGTTVNGQPAVSPNVSSRAERVRRRAASQGRGPMSNVERLFLSPLSKWKLYGRFPMKLFLHIAIVSLVTILLTCPYQQTVSYSGANATTFDLLFLDPDLDDDDNRWHRVYAYSVPALVAALEHFRDAYFSIADVTMVDAYAYFLDAQGLVAPVSGTLSFLDPDIPDAQLSWAPGELTPFYGTPEDTQRLVLAAKRLTLSVHLQSDLHWNGRIAPIIPYDWTLTLTVDFAEDAGRAVFELDAATQPVPHSRDWNLRNAFPRLVIDACLALSSAWSFALTVRAVRKAARLMRLARERLSMKHLTTRELRKLTRHGGIYWEQLPSAARLRFFNGWFVVSFASSALCALAAVLDLVEMFTGHYLAFGFKLSAGIGAGLAWFNLLRYMEYSPQFYMLVLTVQQGASAGLAFLVSILPVFFGFAAFGVAMFGGQVEKFSSFSQACVTQFALLHGDIILETFDDLYAIAPITSRVYIYVFITTFICAVLNIFIVIIEESFLAARRKVYGTPAGPLEVEPVTEHDVQHHPPPLPAAVLDPATPLARPVRDADMMLLRFVDFTDVHGVLEGDTGIAADSDSSSTTSESTPSSVASATPLISPSKPVTDRARRDRARRSRLAKRQAKEAAQAASIVDRILLTPPSSLHPHDPCKSLSCV
jgi:hypothetical protein